MRVCLQALYGPGTRYYPPAQGAPEPPHLGMNESTPSTAPAKTRSAGLILYCSRISRTPTAMAAVSTPKIAPFAMVKQPASRRPIETGASPSE